MKFDDLFEQRELVINNLKCIIRQKGFTKVSLAKKIGITRPTLDKLLNCEVNSKTFFDKYLKKIIEELNLSIDDILLRNMNMNMNNYVDVLYSQNAPESYSRDDKAKKQYNLLMDVVELCAMYY